MINVEARGEVLSELPSTEFDRLLCVAVSKNSKVFTFGSSCGSRMMVAVELVLELANALRGSEAMRFVASSKLVTGDISGICVWFSRVWVSQKKCAARAV